MQKRYTQRRPASLLDILATAQRVAEASGAEPMPAASPPPNAPTESAS